MADYPRVFKNEHGKVTIYRSCFRIRKTEPPRNIYKVRWNQGGGWVEKKTSNEATAIEWAEEAIANLERLQKIHKELSKDKIAYYVTCEHLLEGKATLLDVVQEYMGKRKLVDSILVADAAGNYLSSLKARELSDSHIQITSYRLNRFCKEAPSKLANVTVAHVNEYLSRFRDPSSRQNERATLARFFTWCQLRGLLDPNQLHAVARSERGPRAKRADPGVLTPGQMLRVLASAKFNYPEMVPLLVLGGFGGLRTSEMTRLTSAHVDLERKLIMLPSSITKTSRRRVVHMTDNLHEWLSAFPLGLQHVSKLEYDAKRRGIAKSLGLKWPNNALRHSYISYAVEKTRNPYAVAEECGHDVAILQRHYKALATPEDAEAWFNIRPADLEAFTLAS